MGLSSLALAALESQVLAMTFTALCSIVWIGCAAGPAHGFLYPGFSSDLDFNWIS